MRDSKKRFEVRKFRVRNKIKQISDRPRLIISKSNKHIFAQIVDLNGVVLASASTLEKSIYLKKKNMCNKIFGQKIGELISERAANNGINSVVFDRGGSKYHGLVSVFADAARHKLNF